MRRLPSSVLALLCLTAATGCLTSTPGKGAAPAAQPIASSAPAAFPTTAAKPAVILGYSASWADAAYPPAEYDYSGLTHIARSFLAPHADGSVTFGTEFWNDDLEKQAHAHGVKLLASVGGSAETAAEWLGMARDAAAEQRFFNALDTLITTHHYDGVDIDWEPSALTDADQQAYTAFMVSLRQRFPNWQISTALTPSDWWARHVSWQQLAASVDFINLMTYTFAGPWSGHSGHNANLFPASTYSESGVDIDVMLQGLAKKYGVPPDKLVLGLAFYGAQYSTDKMGQPFPPGARYKGEELKYAEITRLAATPEYQKKWDEGAHVPYLERVGGGHTVSYDDARAISEKCVYAAQHQLRGVMFWYMGSDLVRGVPILQRSLERTYGLPSPEPTLAFQRASYAAELEEVDRISTELDRELRDLEAANPAARARFGTLNVQPAPLAAGADAKALTAAIADVDQKLARLDVLRTDVQRALAAEPTKAGRALTFTGPTLTFASFEQPGLADPLGGTWSASFDKNSLGTTFNPEPITWAKGGHTGNALHMWGHFGRNRAPWPFAALIADFEPTDFSPVQSLRFWTKGNTKKYSASLHRAAVHDYAFPSVSFAAPTAWTLVELPLPTFAQPNWGQKLDPSWSDVTAIAFQPSAEFDDQDYDLWIDDLELVKR